MRLLIIGNLNGHIITASKIALSRGATVAQADTIAQALDNLRTGKGADLAMIDCELDIKGFIKALEAERFSIPVIACGLATDAEPAVAAIKAGAKEYIPLPPDPELIAAVIEVVAAAEHEFIYSDPSMKSIIKLAEQIAPSDASVLITGESGTGKEVMARFIHLNSRRKNNQFVSVNCAAIPEHLMESELFGHEKGAFTGAVARRIGKFEEANGGTLLLDEISEMQPALQAKLLRAIQEREIDRVGGGKPVKIDIRILATSNRDLEQEVKEKKFREDLYFRLNVVPLEIPPLRERPLDVEVLAEFFKDKYLKSNYMGIKKFSNEAMETLRAHAWRGNVRELENTIHRAILLATGDEITPDCLQLSYKSDNLVAEAAPAEDNVQNFLVGRTVEDVERDLIIGTLSHCLGNRTQAAHILGISIRTLRNKIKIYSESGMAVSKNTAYHKAV